MPKDTASSLMPLPLRCKTPRSLSSFASASFQRRVLFRFFSAHFQIFFLHAVIFFFFSDSLPTASLLHRISSSLRLISCFFYSYFHIDFLFIEYASN